MELEEIRIRVERYQCKHMNDHNQDGKGLAGRNEKIVAYLSLRSVRNTMSTKEIPE